MYVEPKAWSVRERRQLSAFVNLGLAFRFGVFLFLASSWFAGGFSSMLPRKGNSGCPEQREEHRGAAGACTATLADPTRVRGGATCEAPFRRGDVLERG